MKKQLLVLALLCGCQATPEPAPPADSGTSVSISGDTAADAAVAPGTRDQLVNRVWVRSDSTGMPGVLRLFLADGTLLQDSCWETYRLSEWTMESDSTLRWSEDGAEIRADVITLAEDELLLRLNLTSGAEDQRFAVATVPYVCPDMLR